MMSEFGDLSEVTEDVVAAGRVKRLRLVAGPGDFPAGWLGGEQLRALGAAEERRRGEVEAVQSFLYSTAPLVEKNCLACVWSCDLSRPVFAQCKHARRGGDFFCGGHAGGPEKRMIGEWDAVTGKAEVRAQILKQGEGSARQRRLRAGGGFVEESAGVGPPACGVWCRDLSRSVFAQCKHPRVVGDVFCRQHAPGPGKRKYGMWDAVTGQAEVPEVTLKEGEWSGRVRVRRALGAFVAASGKEAAGVGQLAARNFCRPPVPQPSFVESVPVQWRESSREPVALLSCPCMLCSEDFATKEKLEAHIQERHGGMGEYGRRLAWASIDRPVLLQEWRHVVAMFVRSCRRRGSGS